MYRWTANELRKVVRGILGFSGQNQISDEDLMRHMNRYWMIVFPSDVKVREQEKVKTLLITKGQEEVEIPPDCLQPTGACFSDGVPLRWFISQPQFTLSYPPQFQDEEVAKGDGEQTLFSFSIGPERVLPETVIVYCSTAQIRVGNYEEGSIFFNALTGEGSVSFAVPPEDGDPVKVKFGVFSFGRPDAALYIDEKLILRPTPDKTYELTFTGREAPAELVEGPLSIRAEWGYLICYGTALEIFCETGNMDGYAQYYEQFKRYEAVALNRTIEDFSHARPIPSF